MKYLSIQDVTKILRQAYRASKRDHLMILLQFQHAARAAEMAALNVEDVQGGNILLRRVKNSLETCQKLVASDNILFDEPGALAAWLEEHPTKKGAMFPSRKGSGHMRPSCVGRLIKQYMQEVGIPESLAHCHTLKHSRLKLLRLQGMKLEKLKRFAGHKALTSTLIYLDTTDSEASEEAQKLSDLMVQAAQD